MRNFFLICALGLFSCGIHEWALPVSENKMVEALQEALFLGSRTAADDLGDSGCSPEDIKNMGCVKGYLGHKLIEIALPDTVEKVLNTVNSFTKTLSPEVRGILSTLIGSSYLNLSQYGDSIKVTLNRGAERAAPASVKVFKDAIFGMSFINAKEILLGDSTAATSYLRTTTYSGLKIEFGSILKEPLDSLKLNKYWESIASNYNSFARTYSSLSSNPLISSSLPSLPYGTELPPDLSTYLTEDATRKALDGLFLMVGKKETELRADPWGTVSAAGGSITETVGDLLGDIFTKAKDKLL